MTELKKAYAVTRIIGISMLCSVLVIAIFTEVLKAIIAGKTGAPFEGFAPGYSFFDTLRLAFFILAIVQFFMMKFLKKKSSPTKGKARDSRAGKRKQNIAELIRRLQIQTILTYIFAESIILYGLVLFLIEGSSTVFFPFFIISIGAFLIHFSRYNQWEEVAKEEGYLLHKASQLYPQDHST